MSAKLCGAGKKYLGFIDKTPEQVVDIHFDRNLNTVEDKSENLCFKRCFE